MKAMDPKTVVGQIHLIHPKDTNFTSLYEESFSKHGQNIELFGVLEIGGGSVPLTKARKFEYEQFVHTLVAAFKKTYITASRLDQNTFEQALATINSALGKDAARGKVGWIGKVNAVVAAVVANHLAISVTGKAHVYLLRKKELSILSDGLNEDIPAPVKIFANYSSGRVAAGDRLVLTASELSNYISQERLREFVSEDTVAEACQEVIQALQDVKNVGFATFVCELDTAAGPPPLHTALAPATYAAGGEPARHPALKLLQKTGRYAWGAFKFLWELLTHLLGAVFAFVYTFFRRRPKKYLFTAIGIALALLLLSVGSAAWKNLSQDREAETASTFSEIEAKLNQAEAALIYEDQNQVVSLMTEAEKMLSAVKGGTNSERESLAARIQELKNKINKEIRIDSPTVLTQFPNIPTELYRSPNGILAFNRNSQSLAFYDFRSGQTAPVLKNQNTSNLVLGEFVGEPHGYVFLTRNGDFERLNLDGEELQKFAQATTSIPTSEGKIQGFSVLGAGATARLYFLDTRANQVWRVRATDTAFGPGETWLKAAANFPDALDMAVDGNIYVLFADRLERYFNGAREDFDLALVSRKLERATKIFATAETNNLYIAEPERERILIFDKNGKLVNQLLSAKFRELADLWVDEGSGIIYVLAGAELLQIKY